VYAILDLGIKRKWVVSFAPQLLYPRYPLDRRLWWAPEHKVVESDFKYHSCNIWRFKMWITVGKLSSASSTWGSVDVVEVKPAYSRSRIVVILSVQLCGCQDLIYLQNVSNIGALWASKSWKILRSRDFVSHLWSEAPRSRTGIYIHDVHPLSATVHQKVEWGPLQIWF
jgi:hypothetical protein